jgi:hypothetical protein
LNILFPLYMYFFTGGDRNFLICTFCTLYIFYFIVELVNWNSFSNYVWITHKNAVRCTVYLHLYWICKKYFTLEMNKLFICRNSKSCVCLFTSYRMLSSIFRTWIIFFLTGKKIIFSEEKGNSYWINFTYQVKGFLNVLPHKSLLQLWPVLKQPKSAKF